MQQRKKAIILYENGFVLGKNVCLYQDIKDIHLKETSKMIEEAKNDCTIIKKDGAKIVLPEAIQNIHQILEKIDEKMAKL